jgi:serine/threonine protein kinase
MTQSREEEKTPFIGKCSLVTRYEKLAKIGEGTYGTVYKAKDKQTGGIVALKQIKIDRDVEREGMPLTAFREIQLLQTHRHPNIVSLLEVAVGYKLSSVFLVCEFCEHDLAMLVDNNKKRFSVSEVKCIITQLLNAVAFLHSNFIIHRDLKLSNLLYNNRGEVKVCDFGLARRYGLPPRSYTPKVLTLWYRAPELLLGESRYTVGVDIWAVGCIFAELLRMAPLLPGKTEVQQLGMIFDLLGTPNLRIWPGYDALPYVKKWSFPDIPYSSIRTKLPGLSEYGYHLLERMLTYDPAKRVSASEALEHHYFSEHPRGLDPALMPTFPSLHGTNQRTAHGDSKKRPLSPQTPDSITKRPPQVTPQENCDPMSTVAMHRVERLSDLRRRPV